MYRLLLDSTGAEGPEVTLLDRLLGLYVFTETGDGHSQQQNKQENKMEALTLSTLTDADRVDTAGGAWV